MCQVLSAFFLLRPKALPPLLAFEKSGDMALVSGGPALIGPERHKIEVSAFYIDKTEVSDRAYGRFLREPGHPKPHDFPEDTPDNPAVNVSNYDSAGFLR